MVPILASTKFLMFVSTPKTATRIFGSNVAKGPLRAELSQNPYVRICVPESEILNTDLRRAEFKPHPANMGESPHQQFVSRLEPI